MKKTHPLNERKLKLKIFTTLFLLALIAMPLLSEMASYSANAWQIAANHGYASADGAAIVSVITGIGWATGALCGVQLIGALIVAG
jgi:hypothetical protein